MIWQVIFALALAGLLWVRLHTLMTYFQQEEYDAQRFWPAILRVRLFDVLASAVVLVAFLLGGWWLCAAALMAFLAWRESRYVYKKPLARTERARRIMLLAAAFLIPAVIAAVFWPVAALVALQLPPLALVIANRILVPFQTRINAHYVDDARAKLARIDPIRIGITGSFGKTTVKHILAELLETSGPVFYSRGSINTVLGLTRHIRERLQFSHRYFIAEMGAYGIGSVARLCGFVQPNYGIVTAVGDAHTERFGSIEAIATAKSELAADVCARGGRVVIAHELLSYAPFAALHSTHPDHIVTVGRSDADVQIISAEMLDGNWQVRLQWPKDGREVEYSLPLLGEHNILNSALAIALLVEIDADAIDEAVRSMPRVQQIPHRLQKREQPGQPLILDDAYNANEAGFLSALDVLATLARQRGGRAILVTPGVAELGDAHETVHAHLGHVAAANCDVIYVVNPERISDFVAAARGGKAELNEVQTLADARRALADAAPEDVILYENDLPDLLEAKRLL